MKKKTWRSAVALLLAVQMAVASGVTAMAQTSAAVGADSPAAVMVAEDAEQDEAVRYLSDMELAKASVGWGELMRDKGLEELPLKLRTADGTQTYSKGLCAHAPSELVVDVEGRGAQRFQAYVGVNYSKNGGSCGFVVKADDQELFNVAKIKESDTQQRVDVEIPAGTKKLTLITTDGGDGMNSDHSVWADAKLLLDASVQKNLHRVTASAGKAMLEVGEATAVSLKGTLVNDSEADLSAADITYASSDEKVATVDDKGVITGVSNGLVTITCEATLDGITKSASVDLIIGNEVEGKVWSIASPDGEVASVFMLGSEGNLSYSVQRENKSVLGFSAMGMNTSVGDFTEGLEFNGVTDAKTVDETYSVNSRKKEEYRNHYTERTIS